MAVLLARRDVRALQPSHLAGRCALPCGLQDVRVAGMIRPPLLGVTCCSWQGLVMAWRRREALMVSSALLKAGRFFGVTYEQHRMLQLMPQPDCSSNIS